MPQATEADSQIGIPKTDSADQCQDVNYHRGRADLQNRSYKSTSKARISGRCLSIRPHFDLAQLTPAVPFETKNSASRTSPEPMRQSSAATRWRNCVS